MRMTSHNRLDDSLRWRAVGRLPVLSGVGSMATSGPKMDSRLWNQFQTSGTVTRKLLSLLETFLLCLEEEFSGNRSTTVLKRLFIRPASSPVCVSLTVSNRADMIFWS
ncbi:hypothetical protein TNCV_643791 [Trichonephila clavipes]|nr:hypothetical protein TNCV_643791 [Trichonephila clavipes]